MNDSIVSTSDIRSVLSQQAYVLFYIRYCQESALPPFLLSQKECFTSSACLHSIVWLNSISVVGRVRKVYLRVGHTFTVALRQVKEMHRRRDGRSHRGLLLLAANRVGWQAGEAVSRGPVRGLLSAWCGHLSAPGTSSQPRPRPGPGLPPPAAACY